MSSSLNIYPFQDTETSIRFVVQLSLFLIGLVITNKLIIKPALRLQREREKRTSGSQIAAKAKFAEAEKLATEYQDKLNFALSSLSEAQVSQLNHAKESASQILLNAQQQSTQLMNEIRENLKIEKKEASTLIHEHINNIVKELYSKLRISL